MKVNKNFDNLVPNYLFAEIAKRVNDYCKANPDKKVIKLGIGDVTLPIPQIAVDAMKKGGVILYPTDTVWGLGCDATTAEAVAKIYKIKQRDDSKALICLADSVDRVQRYVRDVPSVAWDLMELSDKPTTVILDGAVNLAPNLIAEDGSIGLRVTNEPFSKELCYRFQKAIVSTSANISGEPAAQNYCDISPEILEAVDYVCWTRRQEHKPHKPSSIIKLTKDGRVTIIRK